MCLVVLKLPWAQQAYNSRVKTCSCFLGAEAECVVVTHLSHLLPPLPSFVLQRNQDGVGNGCVVNLAHVG